MKFKILKRKFQLFFELSFFHKSEPKRQKQLPEKGFERNLSQIINKAKATGCIELQNACHKKYLTPVISQLN